MAQGREGTRVPGWEGSRAQWQQQGTRVGWHKGRRAQGCKGGRVQGQDSAKAGGWEGARAGWCKGSRAGGFKGRRAQGQEGIRVRGCKSGRAGGCKGRRVQGRKGGRAQGCIHMFALAANEPPRETFTAYFIIINQNRLKLAILIPILSVQRPSTECCVVYFFVKVCGQVLKNLPGESVHPW